MSDLEPPAWLDGPPPASGPVASRGKQNRQAPAATPQDSTDFFDWLLSSQTRIDLVKALPDYISVDQFIATAKDAALANQRLLQPNLRPSLLRAIFKAAKMGLRPDGKEGALVPRYDTETRQYGIVWQPMVWGITKLGRLTGAIQSLTVEIVFLGENCDIDAGDNPAIKHRRDRRIVGDAYRALHGGAARNADGRASLMVNPNDFFERIDCAYCIIKSTNGTETKRWMPRERIALIRDAQGANTPWYGPFLDEMVCKTLILFAAKHVDLDINNPATERFREAMQHDMEIDFEQESTRPVAGANGIGLIGHESKLDLFEKVLTPDTREKVPVETQEANGQPTPPAVAKELPPQATDELRASATRLVKLIGTQNRDTMAAFAKRQDYMDFVTTIQEAKRNDLMVMVRDAAVAAAEREP